MKRAWAAVAVGVAVLVVLWWRADGGDATEVGDIAGEVRARSLHSEPHVVAAAQITGRVTRVGDGSAIAGALVSIRSAAETDAPLLIATDSSGAWTASLAPGKYLIVASADGFLPHGDERVVTPSTPVAIALRPGGFVVHGTISDSGGGGVGDALVAFDSGTDQVVVRSARDGTYHVTLDDGGHECVVTHDDYAPMHGSIHVNAVPVTFDVVLTAAGSIRGVVIARATGLPVANADVDASGGIERRETHASARTDATGAFALHRVGPGAIAVIAHGRGFVTYAPTIVGVAIGEQVDGVRILADRGYTLSGRVVYDGKPVIGATLSLRRDHPRGTVGENTRTGEDGSFEIVGLAPSGYWLDVAERLVVGTDDRIFVVDQDVSGVVVEATPRPPARVLTISGRVEPAGIATIEIDNRSERTTSDEGGRFVLAYEVPDQVKLRATSQRGEIGLLPVTLTNEPMTGVTIRMTRGFSIAGRVVDQDGQPVPGAEVIAGHLSHQRIEDVRSTTADRDGRYQITVQAGPINLSATTSSQSDDRSRTVDVTAFVLSEPRTDVTLVIESRGRELGGQVVDARATAVADAWVTAERVQPRSYATTAAQPTAPDGRFMLRDLRPGKYELVARGPRGESRGTASAMTGDTVVIRLAPMGSIAGRVLIGDAPVVSCGSFGEIHRLVAAPVGAFTLDHLEPGRYECVATSREGVASGAVAVTSGVVPLALRMPRGASVAGIAVDALSGQPFAGMSVGVQVSGDPLGDAAVTDASGHFVLEHVPTVGRLSFTIRSLYSASGAASFAVRDGDRLDLGTIKLPPLVIGAPGELGLTVTYRDPQRVAFVIEDDPAAVAGIVAGDRITTINGVATADLSVHGDAAWRTRGVPATTRRARGAGSPPRLTERDLAMRAMSRRARSHRSTALRLADRI